MEESDIISRFKQIGNTLETSLNNLDRTRTVLEFFEDYIVDKFDLTSEEEKLFIMGIQKIKAVITHVLENIENVENEIFSLCSQLTSEDNLMYSVIMESLNQEGKHD